jgi:hypothetical protein
MHRMGCAALLLCDEAGPEMAELGTPIAVFTPPAVPVPNSRPLLRTARLYFVSGVSYYALALARRPSLDSLDVITALPGLVLVQLLVAACYVIRRRWRVSAVLLAVAVATVVVVLFVAGQQFLRNDWFDPVSDW